MDTLALFNDYADRHGLLEDQANADNEEGSENDTEGADIEASIANELGKIQQARKPAKSARFTPLKTDTECVLFIKTAKFIDPVSFVHGICREAHENSSAKSGGRFIRRLTPIAASADAKLPGLAQCLEKALPREFSRKDKDTEAVIPVKYRIEPTFRNHNLLNRESVIPEIAAAVSKLGPHSVDLTRYDVLIRVEVIRGYLGVSVIRDWEKFRKYNLSEIYTSAHPESAAAE